MSKLLRRYGLALAVALAVGVGIGLYGARPAAQADSAAPPAVSQLESQAGQALLHDQFSQSAGLLEKAATLDPAATTKDLADAAASFQKLEQKFDAERQKEFEKNIKDVHLLLSHDMRDYAVDMLQQAYIRAADPAAFRKEKWVNDLIIQAEGDAQKAEANGQWLTALRIYSDLSGVNPYTPKWKDKLKEVTRRIRLLMLYTPDEFKKIQAAELKKRDAADALLHHPTTQPITADNSTGDFKTDWHQSVQGATFSMLYDTLLDAEHDYYRSVTLQSLMDGGINSLRLMLTTKGLGDTFPGLADPAKAKNFSWDLDQAAAQVQRITLDDERTQVRDCLQTLMDQNHDTVNLPDEVFITEFTNGALDTLDPFSDVIWPDDMPEFKQLTQGTFSGVGIQIESENDGNLKVISPLEDSPAYKAGIQAGDVITRIDGKNAHGITADQAVRSITGKPHTFVVLTVRSPNGDVHNYTIEREKINVNSVKGYARLPGGGWNYFVDPKDKIAYLRITNFTAKTGPELIDALTQLHQQGARALVLDLRYNPGGLLDAAVKVASQFVPDGLIVSTRPDRVTENPPTVNNAEPDDQTTKMPVVVLVNQYSASASEIVSGALQDHNRALIVGQRTFGKGSVQMLFYLADRTAFLKLTTAHYYLPNGKCIHREENSTDWGVDPNLKIVLTPEQMEAAIQARQDMEVLHDAGAASTQPVVKELTMEDPQLAGGVLALRLELAGVQL
jgi:carboxyl-terminal processing protease